MMNIEVIPFDFSYWPQFVELINKHWKENHPIINKELFEWQYTGYGPAKGVQNCRLLLVDGKVEGFRGAIPGLYQYKGKHLLGYSSSIWVINQEYRGMGFGNLMLNSVKKNFDVHCSLGVNVNTAGPIYTNKGYAGYDSLKRYVVPLSSNGYLSLLNTQVELSKIDTWINSLSLNEQVYPITLTSDSLEKLWSKTLGAINIFGLYRSNDFWEWRYINNVGFQYYFFGNPLGAGIVIARIEKILKEKSSLKALRIIEILPSKKGTWDYKKDIEMKELLLGVLAWAKSNGCVTADFQISNSRLSSLMKDTGFMEQSIDYLPPEASLAGLFQPFILRPSPINGVYSIKNITKVRFMPEIEDTYFVKSDNDMDRTNYWPVVD